MLESVKTICLLAGRLGFDAMIFRVTEGIKGLVVELVIRQTSARSEALNQGSADWLFRIREEYSAGCP